MTFLEALILGIIQGLTEFLPVSSSGHLEIGSYILGIQSKDNLLFSIVVHGATALSTIIIFRKDIQNIIIDLFQFQWNESTEFTLKIIISIIPIGVVGVFFEDQIEAFFGGRILLIGFMLLFTGVLLFLTFFKKNSTGEINYFKALLIGFAQTIAIMPGISRSGITIAVALFLGVDKIKATRFSFLMVLIPVIGALLLKIKDLYKDPVLAFDISGLTLFTGFSAAFLTGLMACSWMIAIVKKNQLIYFSIYCFGIGLIAIATGYFV